MRSCFVVVQWFCVETGYKADAVWVAMSMPNQPRLVRPPHFPWLGLRCRLPANQRGWDSATWDDGSDGTVATEGDVAFNHMGDNVLVLWSGDGVSFGGGGVLRASVRERMPRLRILVTPGELVCPWQAGNCLAALSGWWLWMGGCVAGASRVQGSGVRIHSCSAGCMTTGACKFRVDGEEC